MTDGVDGVKVSTLNLFKGILAKQPTFPKEQPYKDLTALINYILRQFFKAVDKEPFLIVEVRLGLHKIYYVANLIPSRSSRSPAGDGKSTRVGSQRQKNQSADVMHKAINIPLTSKSREVTRGVSSWVLHSLASLRRDNRTLLSGPKKCVSVQRNLYGFRC